MEAYIERRSEWGDKKKPRIIAMTAGDAVQEFIHQNMETHREVHAPL